MYEVYMLEDVGGWIHALAKFPMAYLHIKDSNITFQYGHSVDLSWWTFDFGQQITNLLKQASRLSFLKSFSKFNFQKLL